MTTFSHMKCSPPSKRSTMTCLHAMKNFEDPDDVDVGDGEAN